MINFAIWDFPEPGKPLSIIIILDGLLYLPGGHNNVSMGNTWRFDNFSISVFFDILGGDGTLLFICVSNGDLISFSLRSIAEEILFTKGDIFSLISVFS